MSTGNDDKYFLCIDNGLTNTKAVLFDQYGNEKGYEIAESIIETKKNTSEIDMMIQWENTVKVIKRVLLQSKIDPKKIAGIGNTGHGAGLYMVDSNGEPIRKAISSIDSRTEEILKSWSKKEKKYLHSTNHRMWFGQPIPMLYWLKKNEPENYKKIDRIFFAKDWIKYKLTGTISSEYTDLSNCGLINHKTKQYDKELIETFGIGEMYDALPDLKRSIDIVGKITKKVSEMTGLLEHTPVIGGLFDVVSCNLGCGAINDKKYYLIAGTWNINSYITENLVNIKDFTKCTLFADENKYIYTESSATSAVNLEWFITSIKNLFMNTNMKNSEIFSIIDKKIEESKIEEDLLYFPFLHKSTLVKNINSGFLGIIGKHDIYDLIKGIYEGVVFAHKMHIDNLKQKGMNCESAVITGGAANSDVWCQMFADILNINISTTSATQDGALGIAVCIAVALGIYNNFEEAISKMVKEGKKYQPDMHVNSIYNEKFKKFIKIINKLD